MEKQICIITGATDGIGKATVWGLASVANLVMVLPCRNTEKAEKLKQEVVAKFPTALIEPLPCDLASFESIHKFVKLFAQKYDKLHLLINNAGIWNNKKQFSRDGIELNLAVNHFAPFLLTNLLIEHLKVGASESLPARIINVSSDMHAYGTINFDDLEMQRNFDGIRAYAQSKLANILFTKVLAERLKPFHITANSLMPGVVISNLFNSTNWFVRMALRTISISPEQGAETTLFLATDPSVKHITGEYFYKKKTKRPAPKSQDQQTAEQLWKVSEKYVGLW